jgi:hypothetical protein
MEARSNDSCLNSYYSEGRRQRFKTSPGTKLARLPISTNEPGVEHCSYNNIYVGGIGRRIIVCWPGEKVRTYLKNKAKSTGGVAQVVECQVQGLEFKTQQCKKEKKGKKGGVVKFI